MLDGLQFHNHPAFDEEISAEALLEDHAVIFKADSLLPLDLKTPPLQRPSQHHPGDVIELLHEGFLRALRASA